MINQEIINYIAKKLWIEEDRKRIANMQIDLYRMRALNDDDIIHKNLNKEISHDCDVRIDLLKGLLKELKQLKGGNDDNNLITPIACNTGGMAPKTE